MSKVAFLCLGTMGYPMAGHLAAAGHGVTVYNRSAEKAERWVAEHGGERAATPGAAAAGAELVFVCSGNDADVRDVVMGDAGALAAMSEGAVLVDHTTVSAVLAREIAAVGDARGVSCLDAPVSGGESGAVNGALTVMVGGEASAFERAREAIAAYGRKIVLMGPAGAGQLTKMVNQICIAGVLQGLSEGLRFAERAGLDAERAVEVISQGAAQSWQMDNRALSMLERKFDFGFAVDWMRKDLAIALEEAARVGAALPVAEQVDEFYAEIQAEGGHRWDTSSLITRLG